MIVAALFAVLAASLQLLTLYEVVKFVTSPAVKRALDMRIIMAVSVASMVFVLVQALHLTFRPERYTPDNVFVYLWGTFHLFNAMVYFTVVRSVSHRKRYLCAPCVPDNAGVKG